MTSAADTIARALSSEDAEDRRQATAELGRFALDEALPLLLDSLGDEDWRVRKEATLVARSFGGAPELLDALVQLFAGGDNVGLRNAAVDVLAGAGPAASAALCAALPQLDADGRKLAVETLGRGRDPAALPALVGAMEDTDDNVREGAMEAIAALGTAAPERVAEVLLTRLDDRDRLVRLTALEGLTALEVAIPWPRLAPLLREPTLRSAALAAAALTETPEAARALAEAAGGARGKAFDQALRALGRLAEGSLAPSVAEALRSAGPALGQRLVGLVLAGQGGGPSSSSRLGDDGISRRAIALRLASLSDASGQDGGHPHAPGIVDAALAALGEDLLAETAQRALVTLGVSALPAIFARLGDADVPPDARAALVDVIAEVIADASITTGEALAALRGAARDAERQVAVRALRAIARLGEEGDLSLAAEQALHPERPVAVAAEGALATLATRFPAAARALADRVASDEAYLLPVAILIGSLGSQGSRFADKDALFLAHAATAGDTRARRAAIEAVATLRAAMGSAYPAAMEVLSFALTDEEHEVQTAAARALGRLCSAKDAPRPGELLDLVDRSGAADLVATAVRAAGEGMAAAVARSGSAPAALDELISALAHLVRGAPSPVAIAAVDSLAHVHRALGASSSPRPGLRPGEPGYAPDPAVTALAGALDHPDEDVAKAAVLKLAGDDDGVSAALSRALEHPSAAVRGLAAEILAERGERGG